MSIPPEIKEFLKKVLLEDISHRDITTELIIPSESISAAIIKAKEDFILAGIPFVKELFEIYDPQITFNVLKEDGTDIKNGDILAEIRGKTHSILACERTGLNILQRLSGIATLTKKFVMEINGTDCRILDTRKTTPGMRYLEKYAVRTGGGYNHRFGLYDGILIKDNHIKVSGGIKKAIDTLKNNRAFHHLLKIEVEVKDIDEVKEAIEAGADIIMLDNMNIEEMKKAVKIIREKNPSILIEASGNVDIKNVRAIAETGVNFISAGMLTHSARAVDISLKIIN